MVTRPKYLVKGSENGLVKGTENRHTPKQTRVRGISDVDVFISLQQKREAIEREFGEPLQWKGWTRNRRHVRRSTSLPWRSSAPAAATGKGMTLALYRRVVLTRDHPEYGLRVGDLGVIVEHCPMRADVPEGYEIEVFAAAGQTIAVVSVPASGVREPTEHDVLCVRRQARA